VSEKYGPGVSRHHPRCSVVRSNDMMFMSGRDEPDTVEDEEPHGRTEGLCEEVVAETGEVWVKASSCCTCKQKSHRYIRQRHWYWRIEEKREP
jgi:hypothetical protein